MRKIKGLPINKHCNNRLIQTISTLCFLLFVVLTLRPVTITAAEDSIQDNNTNNTVESGTNAIIKSYQANMNEKLHAFYPSNAVFSQQIQKYIDEVDSLSFAWSRINVNDPGTLNTVKGKNGNKSFYYPKDYLQPVKYAKSKGKSIQLNIYMKGSEGAKLLPYDDKRSAMVQGIIESMQEDITTGEGLYYDGVVIDFEGLRDTDDGNTPILYDGKQISAYFIQFLSELKPELTNLGKKLYVAVNPRLFYDGYDYKSIYGIADRIILMAHDYEPTEQLRKDQVEQYTSYDALEPINSLAPYQMVRQALNDMQNSASNPSELSKVWLQIAFDSAQWQYDVNNPEAWDGLDNAALSRKERDIPLYKTIKDRVDNKDGYGKNITYGYNNEIQSPYIQYYNTKDKSFNVIIYEDSNSISAKIDLAKAYGLGGISIWSVANVPDYNDSTGKKFYLDGWTTIISKMKSFDSKLADSKKYVSFSDKMIEKAVREKLGKLTGKITVYDVKSIYRLKLPAGVKKLSDMKNLVNLEYLDAQELDLKDITAIGNLTKLKVLYLRKNKITDISPIKNLKSLEVLSVSDNQVVSLLPLAALTKLQELYLYDNKIDNLSPLSKLTDLRILKIGTNRIKKIDSLKGLKKLTLLSLEENQISDIAGIKDMRKLSFLNLANNNISDLQPLKNLFGLELLYLQRNSLRDMKALSGLVNLKELSLNGNQISDIKAVTGLSKLEKLYIKENKVSNITPLAGLKNLKVLSLDKNLISDIKPLAGLFKMEELYLPENKIVSISSLKGLVNLKVLSLNRNSISNLKPVVRLTSLEKLYIKDNRIASISSLKDLKQLQELYLSGNKVSDYSPVEEAYSTQDFLCDFQIKGR